MAIKERDVVLTGKENGNETIDLPITRLGNIEAEANVKAMLSNADALPLIDSADGYEMKKITWANFKKAMLADTDNSIVSEQGVYGIRHWNGKLQIYNGKEWETASMDLNGDRIAISTVPSQSGTLTYTGSSQTPSWSNYDSAKLTLGGTTSSTNAGSYTVTFTPTGNYQWSDGSTSAKSVTWEIKRANIANVPSQSGTLTYTGSSQTPSWSNYDSAKLTLGGTTSNVATGTFTATFTPTGNYQWSDGSTTAKNVNWTIGKAAISATPTQSGTLTYTGSSQTPSWSNYDSAKLTLGGTTSSTNAGSYTVTFTPTGNYQWSDGSTTAKNVNWTIGKVAGSLSISLASLTLDLSNLTRAVTVTRSGDGAISATSSNTGVATVTVSGTTVTVNNVNKTPGTATITVNVAAGTNHNAPSKVTCAVTAIFISTTLKNNTWAQIAEVAVAGTASSYWKVGDEKGITLTTGETLTLQIYGFNHDDKADGSGKAGITFGLKHLMSERRRMLTDTTSPLPLGFFASSSLYAWLQGDLYDSLPADLRNLIKSVNKKTNRANTGPEICTDSAKIFTFSEAECTSFTSGEGSQYPIFTDVNSRRKGMPRPNGTFPYGEWGLRSPTMHTPYQFLVRYVSDTGNLGSSHATSENGVCFGFCI